MEIDTGAQARAALSGGSSAEPIYRLVAQVVRSAGLPPGVLSVVASVETIEHLENPRVLMRELVRLARPGGLVLLTTPNQLSLLSKLTLVVKNEFNAFQRSAGLYPAHITALLEQDLRNIAEECGLRRVEIHYTNSGRIPFSRHHWPARLGLRGRWFSDNVLLAARKPG